MQCMFNVSCVPEPFPRSGKPNPPKKRKNSSNMLLTQEEGEGLTSNPRSVNLEEGDNTENQPNVAMETCNFEVPKVKKTRYSKPIIPIISPTLTSNRFSVLFTETEPTKLSSNESSLNQKTPANTKPTNSNGRKLKIPPIFLCEAEDYQSVLKDIKDIVSSPFEITQCYKKLKISLSSPDDFRTLTKYYDNDPEIKYYTFANPEDKLLSVVIRGLPYSLTEQEIFDEIKQLNLPVQRVTRLLNREKFPTPLCSVLLENTERGKAVFELNRLCHMVVKVEARRHPQGPLQCTNCLQIGHTKKYCRLDPKCPRCTGDHRIDACPNLSQTAKCANCGGQHSALYKGCPSFQKFNPHKQTTKTEVPLQPKVLETSKPKSQTNDQSQPCIQKPNFWQERQRARQTEQLPPTSTAESFSYIFSLISNLIKPFIPDLKKLITNFLTLLNNSNEF